ncbi:histidine kinase, partial [Saprospiraceae bacterium]|nr:histidine kinase [Saprospiraceae bacterium]
FVRNMEKSNLYLVLLIATVLGACILNSTLITPNEYALIKDKTFLDRKPQVNDLFILKDSSNLKPFFKIKKINLNGMHHVVYGKSNLDWGLYEHNISYLKQLIQEDQAFDLERIQNKTDAELITLFARGELEGDAVYKVDKLQMPIFLQILSSYFGYLFLVLVVFLLIWFSDVIGQFFQRISNLPKQSRFYFLAALGVYAYFRMFNNPIAFDHSGISWLFGVLGILPVVYAFKFVKKKVQNLPFSEKEARKFGTLLLVGIISFVLAFSVSAFILDKINEGPPNIMHQYIFSIPALLGQSFLLWTAMATGNFLNNFRKHFLTLRKQESKLKEAQKNELASQAELDALQARINPHFLYNSLNSIASLAQIDPPKTEAMAMALSKFYKYSTNRGEEHLSSIEEEIDILKTYLEIEEIRFGERLQFGIDHQKSDFKWRIPRFLLQPIVENAIKHGYNKKENSISIQIQVKEKEEEVSFEIFDNGQAFPENMNVGYGLRSVQKKLKLLFPDKHQFEFVNAPKKHVLIKINQ